ncbi:MAG: late competence development ComFB family protein [Betaproteobacteria bacterium]
MLRLQHARAARASDCGWIDRHFNASPPLGSAIIFPIEDRPVPVWGASVIGEGFDSVHNYYERLVIDEVQRVADAWTQPIAVGLLADIACVALNKLPARYIRHEVDHAFFRSGDERETHRRRVTQAVEQAFAYVNSGESRVAA